MFLTFLVFLSTVFAAEPAVLLTQGKYSEALESLKNAESAQDLANRCTAKYKLADYAGAVADCEKAVKKDKRLRAAVKAQTSDSYYRLGLAAEGKQEPLYEAVRWDRDNPLPLLELGKRAMKQREWKTALRYLDRAISADPSNGGAYKLRSWTHRKLGHTRQAELDNERAIKLLGGMPDPTK